jgi:hypothetical protein
MNNIREIQLLQYSKAQTTSDKVCEGGGVPDLSAKGWGYLVLELREKKI